MKSSIVLFITSFVVFSKVSLVCSDDSIILSPPTLGGTIEDQFSYLSKLLTNLECDLDRVLDYVWRQKRTISVELNGPASGGGFGAQICLQWIPRAMTSLGFGARLALNVAEQPWNYGCPEHETASDVLLNVFQQREGDSELYKQKQAMGGIGMLQDFPVTLICNGKEITPVMVRAALASYYFKFEPYFEQKIRNEILKVKLPSSNNILAVHVRGGDKLVAEWRTGSLSNPDIWALKIKTVISNERIFYKSDILEYVVFVESDDCNLLLEVKKSLDKYNIKMIHLPCELKNPILYTQKSHSVNVTGHHQYNWNKQHTCIDTIKYFTGLTIFQEASAVLLGSGGDDQGLPLAGTGTTSNTALLIELLRKGYSEHHLTKRTYNLQVRPRGMMKYPNGTLSMY